MSLDPRRRVLVLGVQLCGKGEDGASGLDTPLPGRLWLPGSVARVSGPQAQTLNTALEGSPRKQGGGREDGGPKPRPEVLTARPPGGVTQAPSAARG